MLMMMMLEARKLATFSQSNFQSLSL